MRADAAHRPSSFIHCDTQIRTCESQLRRRRGRRVFALAKSASSAPLLRDIVSGEGSFVSPKISVTEPREGSGRGIIALEDLHPNEPLISMPMQSAFYVLDEGARDTGRLPWSVEMAWQIITAKKEDPSPGKYAAWFKALPLKIDLPISTFAESELQACGDKIAIKDAESVRSMFDSACEELETDLEAQNTSKDEFVQILNAVHSRTFIRSFETENGVALEYVIAPGIDMANHSFSPNAKVEIESSPEACQGLDASSEICDTEGIQPTQSVRLVVQEQKILKGQEITVSYGNHSDEVFFMYFGFLPAEQDFNTVAFFTSQQSLSDFMEDKFPKFGREIPEGNGFVRYFGSREGFDPNLCNDILAWLDDELISRDKQKPSQPEEDSEKKLEKRENPSQKSSPPSKAKVALLQQALKLRCLELNSEFARSKRQATEGSKEFSENKALALRYLERKQTIIDSLLSQV